MIKKIFCLIFGIVNLSIAAYALAPTWKIIPQNSKITFTAIQNNAPVSGEFKTFSGEINFDPNQLADSQIKILININSITTTYSELTSTLKSADWFDVAHYPQALFTAKAFTKTQDNSYQAQGTLQLRDKTLPITLTFQLKNYSPTQAFAEGSAVIKRTAYGVGQGEWSSINQVKDEVTVNFSLSAEK